MEHSLDAINIDPVSIHDGRTARAVVVAVVVFVIGGVLEFPNELPALRVQTAQSRSIALSVKQIETAPADGRHAVTGSHRFLPDEPQPFGRPGTDDSLF